MLGPDVNFSLCIPAFCMVACASTCRGSYFTFWGLGVIQVIVSGSLSLDALAVHLCNTQRT